MKKSLPREPIPIINKTSYLDNPYLYTELKKTK